jgi:hypothetical protein
MYAAKCVDTYKKNTIFQILDIGIVRNVSPILELISDGLTFSPTSEKSDIRAQTNNGMHG